MGELDERYNYRVPTGRYTITTTRTFHESFALASNAQENIFNSSCSRFHPRRTDYRTCCRRPVLKGRAVLLGSSSSEEIPATAPVLPINR